MFRLERNLSFCKQIVEMLMIDLVEVRRTGTWIAFEIKESTKTWEICWTST